jgi:hypothetical protein
VVHIVGIRQPIESVKFLGLKSIKKAYEASKGQCHEKSVLYKHMGDALCLQYEPLPYLKIF